MDESYPVDFKKIVYLCFFPIPSICSMQSQAGAYRLVLPTHLTVDNILSADQCVVTVIIRDESKMLSTWLEAANSESKLFLPQRWLS